MFRLLAFVFLLSGCARDLSSNVYTSDSTLNLTLKGEIISTRKVTIKNDDKIGGGTGSLAGGAIGATAGNSFGGGSGQTAAIASAAVAGAMIGSVVQNELGSSEGYEYIIKVDTSDLKDDYYEGSGAMRAAISSATTSGLVTIVQGNDILLKKSDPVYVIFSDKRTRVIKDK